VVLEAIAGPHYPATAFWAEDLSAAELAVDAVPEAPEPWFLLGDVFFHLGPGLGRPHSWEQADRAFRRAFELDSAFMAPLEHMVELTAATGDLDEAKRLARMYFGSGQMSQNADFLRWRLAVAARDSAGLARIREALPGMTTASLLRIVGTGQLEGVASLELDHAAAVLGSRPAPVSERWLIGRSLHYFALNRGRVRHAATEAALDPEGQPLPDWAERLVVLDGLFGDGDTLAAIRSLQHLDHQPQPGSDDGSSGRAARDANLCVSENWRTLRREGARTRETIARLRQPWVGEDSLGVARSNLVCATLLEAVVAQRTLGAEVSYPLRRLDSLMLLGPAATNEVETFGNLVVAQLYERAGEPEAALAALRRRPYQWAYGPMFLTTFLREEGRLAASTGDREGAIRAYHHYLALRTAPDSSLFRVVTDVRRELSRLASER
jgi:hypothetical protein